MATQLSAERRRRVSTPFLTLVVAIALVAGVAIGVQALHSATSPGALAGAPVPTAATNAGNPVPLPLPAMVVPTQACSVLDARAYGPYCDPRNWTSGPIATPRANWLACEAMDPTAYRQLCLQGDGGRWVEGARSPGQ